MFKKLEHRACTCMYIHAFGEGITDCYCYIFQIFARFPSSIYTKSQKFSGKKVHLNSVSCFGWAYCGLVCFMIEANNLNR